MNILRKNALYFLLNLAAFYGLPMVMTDVGSEVMLLMTVFPFICFVTSLFSGYQNGFEVLFAVAVVAFFLPSVSVYYNETAIVYGIIYGVIAILGSFLGGLIRQKGKR